MTLAGVSSGRGDVEHLDLPVPQPLRDLLHEATSTRGPLGRRGRVQERLLPQLDRQQRPQPQRVVRAALRVDLDQTLHLGGVEEAASRDRGRGQHVVDHRLQIADEPGADGRAEAGLGPVDDVVRQRPLHALLEEVLAREPAQLELRRDPAGELDHAVVEQRHAHLSRRGHAHLVGVRQVQARQEGLLVDVEDLVEPVLAADAVEVAAVAPERIVAAELAPQVRRKDGAQLLRPVVRAVR